MSNDDEEQVIRNTLQELRHLDLKSDVPVVGKELREIILRQMELNRSFFERQHQDVNEMHSSVKRFTASSKRVEKLTMALIGLTGVLAVMTFLLIPR